MSSQVKRCWVALSCAAWCALVLSVGTAQAQGAAATQEKPQTEADQIYRSGQRAMLFGDFAELERLHALYQQPDQMTSGGRSRLRLFYGGVVSALDGPEGAPDVFLAQIDAYTRQLAASHPGSSLAHALHAQALYLHGLAYRGTGFSRTVSPEAWREFERYIGRSLDYIAQHREVLMRSSTGYLMLLKAGARAGWEFDRLWAVAQAGLQLNPEDERLFSVVLDHALPKWGGSGVQVDRLIQDIARRTAAKHGDVYYARLYAWASDREFSERLFEDTGASWIRMKNGFQQQVVRHPSPANRNALARFACMARDKPTALEALQAMADEWDADLWGSNPQRTFQACKRWATSQ